MKIISKRLLKQPNLWIATTIILFNFFAWYHFLLPESKPYVVEPIRDPEVVTLLDYIRSGDHSGETWEVTLTELEAEQTITWYLQRYPQIPFAHPQIEITPDYVAGKGDATIIGMDIEVGGKAQITLKDGLPIVHILELNLPIPGPIRETIDQEIQRQLGRAELLPVRFTDAEWREGEVIVRGYIR